MLVLIVDGVLAIDASIFDERLHPRRHIRHLVGNN